jgi:hypothetical protein
LGEVHVVGRVILLYGIETVPGGSEERNWPSRLEAIWDEQKQPFAAYSWQWSGLFWKYAVGVFTWIPWYRRKINQSVIDNLNAFDSFLEGVTGKQEVFSIVAHSYAGTLVQAALEQGMHFYRIILIATTMDENFDWSKYSSQFQEVLVYWSDADNICGQSTYGQQGLVGPKKSHPCVLARYLPNMKHFDWIKPVSLKLFSKEWADFLK